MVIVSGIGNIVVYYVKDSSQIVYIGIVIVIFVIVVVIIFFDVFLFLKWI